MIRRIVMVGIGVFVMFYGLIDPDHTKQILKEVLEKT